MKTLKNFIINFILFIFAYLIFIPLSIINFVLVLIKNTKYSWLKTTSEYFYQSAMTIDQYGNKELRTLFNNTLIKENSSYPFGDWMYTISYVLAKNQQKNTLTKTGKILVWIIEVFDKGHMIKTLEYFNGKNYNKDAA